MTIQRNRRGNINPNVPSSLDGAAQATTPEGPSIFAAIQQQLGL